MLSKKNFGLEDVRKILSVMGYDLIVDFKPNENGEET